MFKKNPNRPEIAISLKKVPNGYKVVNNDSFNPFSFKRITRAVFRSDLYQGTHQGADGNFGGLTANTSIVQPPLHLTIPLFSKWFDLDNIHEIEKEEFPEFFQQQDEENKLFKKSPKLYKFYRNFIIALWRENSKKYLSPAVCRKNLSGDVSCIIRIHAFLQHWGLINFPSREHSKGFLESAPKNYYCLVCEETNATQFYVTQIENGVLFEICDCCFHATLYPQYLSRENFRKIIPQIHEKKKKKQMKQEQIKKLLEIIMSENMKERQIWVNINKYFPNYSKEEILKNFLEIPGTHKMNANIFENNQDLIPDSEPQQNEQPTVFEDYQNPEQAAIAISYFLWKKHPSQYPELEKLFIAAEQHSFYLSQVQKSKINQMIRMLTDLQQSKMQLKSIFLQQYDKLIKSQQKTFKKISSNCVAELMKAQQLDQMNQQ